MVKTSLFLSLFVAASFASSSAFAWRFSTPTTVIDITPFPGGGFDVYPVGDAGIAGCADFRVQSGVLGLTEGDTRAYLGIALLANATGRKLTFVVNDSDCYVYRIVLK